ncbi:MAG: GldG family protein, partial [Candidatus Parabeggiatoa sp.]|nr:GldG family protein [Candidatus Parabeggiatoa sp.]
MNQKMLTTTGLLIAIILFLAINIVSDVAFKSARLDLTENQLYTLSEGSKNILKALEEPITLRFFISQKVATRLPGISSYTVRVRELLEEYQRTAGDKLKLKLIDPEPFSEEEDQAEGYGLQGIPVDDSNTTFYFGLAGTNSTDDEEVIPFFSPNRTEFLEYDLTKLIHQLDKPKQKVVGIMSTLPVQGNTASPFQQNAAKPWMIVDHIRQLFEVRTVETNVEKIPDNIDMLMLIHPKDFSEATLYALDQFVLSGGRMIVFADPYSEVYEPPSDPKNPFAAMQAPRNSELSKLFDAWGLEIVPNKVV